MQYAIYKKSTGEVTSTGSTPSIFDAMANETAEFSVYVGAAEIGQKIIDGVVINVEKTPQQLADEQWVIVRRLRDGRLSSCDWVAARAIETGTTVPADWMTYRQALRDITNQTDPFNIAWPIAPNSYTAT